MGTVYPLPSRLGGLGERRKLPQRGLGRSPGRKLILMHFELEKTNLVMTNYIFFVIFIAHIWSQIYKASFDIFFSFAGGGLGPYGCKLCFRLVAGALRL